MSDPESYQDGPPFPRKQRTTATFAEGDDSITVTFTDASVLATSNILPSVGIDADRETDELELDPLIANVGLITPGVSYDVVVSRANADSAPFGPYIVSTHRW